jgi:hypothetical protein
MFWEIFDAALTFALGLILVLAFITIMANMSRR